MNPNVIAKNYEPKFFSRRKQKKDEFLFWINYTFSLLLWLIVILFIYYIWILNINATKWYDIRTLEIQKQNLLLEKELLEVKISNLESLKNIKSEESLNNIMEKVENPDFAVIKTWTTYAYNN